MKNDVISAIDALLPDANYVVHEPYGYDQLFILDDSGIKPTKEAIEAKIVELDAAEPMRLLRYHRDNLLFDSDWTQYPDVPDETKTKWQAYRQSLRDLPASADPKLDSKYNLDMTSVSWPVKPS